MEDANLFCDSCGEGISEYITYGKILTGRIRGKEIRYLGNIAICTKCGGQISVPSIQDENLSTMYAKYYEEEMHDNCMREIDEAIGELKDNALAEIRKHFYEQTENSVKNIHEKYMAQFMKTVRSNNVSDKYLSLNQISQACVAAL